MKKRKIKSELIYFLAILILAFAVNLMTLANLGLSAIVSPAYVLSLKINGLTYGQAEYIIESILFIVFCILMKRFRITYLSSFITGILYATMADILKKLFPFFSMTLSTLGLRIMFFILGMFLSAIAIALFYKTYFYPQIYDFFVKEIAQKYQISIQKFKTGFDLTFFILATVLSFLFFHELRGIGIGTLIMASCNGTLIDFFIHSFDHYFISVPMFENLKNILENKGGFKNGI